MEDQVKGEGSATLADVVAVGVRCMVVWLVFLNLPSYLAILPSISMGSQVHQVQIVPVLLSLLVMAILIGLFVLTWAKAWWLGRLVTGAAGEKAVFTRVRPVQFERALLAIFGIQFLLWSVAGVIDIVFKVFEDLKRRASVTSVSMPREPIWDHVVAGLISEGPYLAVGLLLLLKNAAIAAWIEERRAKGVASQDHETSRPD